ncbi:MAG: methyl-accepting chemotaxis protein [Spirochaetaceae bacterium]|nr:MAG: methyl-accepting chemotaxis protein [Spirochaetaceae bacterium]
MKSSHALSLAAAVTSAFVAMLLVILLTVGVLAGRSLTNASRAAIEANLRGQALLVERIQDELADKAVQVATVIAELEVAREAYRMDDEAAGRELLASGVMPLVEAIERARGEGDFRVHFHKAPAVSFFRTWTDQAGDDLSSFRNTILEVERTRRPVRGAELGRGGFVIRGLAPVMSGDEYLGSVEVYYQPQEILRFLDLSLETGIVLLVNADAAEELFFGEDFERYFQGRFGDSVVSEVSADWIDLDRMLDPSVLEQTVATGDIHVQSVGSYELAYIPFADYQGQINGHIVAVINVGPLRDAARAELNTLLLVIFALMLLGSVVTVLFTRRVISRPLNATADRLKDISVGDGDLTARLSEKRGNEVGRVARHFNSFVSTLAGIVSGIKTSTLEMTANARELDGVAEEASLSMASIEGLLERISDQVVSQQHSINQSSSSVEEITGNITSLQQTIQTLSTRIEDSAAAVEEMTANVSSITRNLEHVDEFVGQLVQSADRGREAIQLLSGRITAVAEQSAQLQQANALIASIAARTNLLAMNAAIEAAHAGEYGRGFAVVAEEIRALAENSSLQSKVIRGELRKTRDGIEESVNASGQAEQAFEAVGQMILEVRDLETNVRDALREQEAGSVSVMQNLHGMRDLGTEVNGGIQEISVGSGSILEEMNHLVEISGQITRLTSEIGNGGALISYAIQQIREFSEQNRVLVKALQDGSDRFTV